MLKSEGDRLNQVIVCTPIYEYGNASDFEKHNIGALGEVKTAVSQHNNLKSTLRAFGADVIDLPELEAHPNSVFTRDTALSTPKGYVKLRLGIESREGEDVWMAAALDALGEPCVGEITVPGTVEGGDVILADDVAFVGQSIRTNAEGIRQLSALLEPMGYEMRVIELPDTILHLDKTLMVLGAKQLIYCEGLISTDDIAGFDGIPFACGEDTTANIICLGDGELLINRSNKLVMARLEAEGFIIHDLNLEEFAKGMGGPNCLIMPVRRGA